VGQNVFYQPSIRINAAPGAYKIVAKMPIERDSHLIYRIKNTVEAFERIADESELSAD
jgi:hypothetical protein